LCALLLRLLDLGRDGLALERELLGEGTVAGAERLLGLLEEGRALAHVVRHLVLVELIVLVGVLLVLALALLALELHQRERLGDAGPGGRDLLVAADQLHELRVVALSRQLDLGAGALAQRANRLASGADHVLVLLLGYEQHVALGAVAQSASRSASHRWR